MTATMSKDSADFLAGGGNLGNLIRAKDWSATPLGSTQSWPESLRTSVSTCINCSFPILIWWGPQLVKIYNDAYSHILGGKHPDALGSRGETVWPEIWDTIGPVLRRVMEEGEAFPASDLRLDLHRNGYSEECYFSFSYSPIRDEAGRVAGVFCPVVETTDRVFAERRAAVLLELEDRLRSAVDPKSVKAAAATIIGKHLGASKAAYAEIHSGDEFARIEASWHNERLQSADGLHHLGDWGSALVSDLERNRLVFINDAQADPRFVSAELPRHNTKLKSRSFVIAPIAKYGRLLGFLFVSDTIPRRWNSHETDLLREVAERIWSAVERTRAQSVLAAERRQFAALFEQAPGFMCTLRGPKHIFEFANPAYYQLVGHRELIGKSAREAFPELEGKGFFELLTQVYETGEAFSTTNAEIGFQNTPTASIEQRFLDFVYQPIKDSSDAVTGIFVEGFDATERAVATRQVLESEARLRSINESLEARVEERTRELLVAEDALRQSQKMEAVGQLTGGIAHDFNNLIGGISGCLELLERRVGEGQVSDLERYISIAQHNVRRAASLTQRLLAFARRQTLDPRPINADMMIMDMADLIQRSVGPTVRLEIVPTEGLWAVKVDVSQLENAVLNLCINARDAMVPDGGSITLTTANNHLDGTAAKALGLDPGEYVAISVSDTGGGMTEEVISKAFDPFFTTKPLGEGTGLGLSMVYGFVRQSSGQVDVKSKLGKGTTVALYLPREIESAPVGEVIKDSRIDLGDGETVLVIDDEAAIRMLVTETLSDSGYRLIEAEDGAAGLEALKSVARIDLLITDVGLPGGLNGRQVADAAREIKPNLKVLFMTGYADGGTVDSGRLDPGMSVIKKPFAIAALASKVHEIIKSGTV